MATFRVFTNVTGVATSRLRAMSRISTNRILCPRYTTYNNVFKITCFPCILQEK